MHSSIHRYSSRTAMQVKLIKNENGLDEWMMIELQGEIVSEGPLEGRMICNIGWRKDNSEALMLIGHHLLEGKVSKLEKPFLVAACEERDGKKVFVADAVIRRRLLFKTRPKPVVTKQLVKKADLERMNAARKSLETVDSIQESTCG